MREHGMHRGRGHCLSAGKKMLSVGKGSRQCAKSFGGKESVAPSHKYQC